MVDVVAALIWDGDRFLACQRPANKARALLWEFVGGKVEPGETKEDALIRECREELDVLVDIQDVFIAVDHVYPDITIRLTLFNATIVQGNPRLLEHNDMRWLTVDEIPAYDFCPADREILSLMIAKFSPTIAGIQKSLTVLSDAAYKSFQAKLIPEVSFDSVLGVRVPALREFAKHMPEAEKKLFLKALPHKYYDENLLHSILVSEKLDITEVIASLDDFIPYIDNWAVCDTIAPKAFKSSNKTAEGTALRWLDSEYPFGCRLGIVLLMKYFMKSAFSEKHLHAVSAICSDNYYVNMAIAWYFATALVDHYDLAICYLEDRKLDVRTHRMTIQKAIDSFRISQDKKVYLRSLR